MSREEPLGAPTVTTMVHSKDKKRTSITSLAAYITIPLSPLKAPKQSKQPLQLDQKWQKVAVTSSNKAKQQPDPI